MLETSEDTLSEDRKEEKNLIKEKCYRVTDCNLGKKFLMQFCFPIFYI